MDIKWVMILAPPSVHQRIFALIYGSPVVYIYNFFLRRGWNPYIKTQRFLHQGPWRREDLQRSPDHPSTRDKKKHTRPCETSNLKERSLDLDAKSSTNTRRDLQLFPPQDIQQMAHISRHRHSVGGGTFSEQIGTVISEIACQSPRSCIHPTNLSKTIGGHQTWLNC